MRRLRDLALGVCALFLCSVAEAGSYRDVMVPAAAANFLDAAMTNEGAVIIGSSDSAGIFTIAVRENGDTVGPTPVSNGPAAPTIASNGVDLVAAWTYAGTVWVCALDASGHRRGDPYVLAPGEGTDWAVTGALGDHFIVAWLSMYDPYGSPRLRWVILDRAAHPLGPVHTLAADWLTSINSDHGLHVAASGDRFAVVVPTVGLHLFKVQIAAIFIDGDKGEIIGDPVVVGEGDRPYIAAAGDGFVVGWTNDLNVSLRTVSRDGALGLPVTIVSGYYCGLKGIAFDGAATVVGEYCDCSFPCAPTTVTPARISVDGRLIESLGAMVYGGSGDVALAARNGFAVMASGSVNVRLINVRITPRTRVVHH